MLFQATAVWNWPKLWASVLGQATQRERDMRNLTKTSPAWCRQGPGIALAAAFVLAAAVPQAQADEAQARELLGAMTDYLEAQPSLSFDVDSSVDVVTTEGQKLTIATSGSVALQRPDKLHVLRKGGFATIEMVYDGATLSVLNREANVFGQAAVAGTVDQLIETLRTDFQRPLPAADLLGSDVGAVLLADVTAVTDLGSGVIRGQECDHLAFRTDEVDWQIWIAQGEVPHPCRFVITSKTIAGHPEYRLEFSGWGAGAVGAGFAFEAPAGASQVEVGDVPDLDEVTGIFVVTKGN